MSKKIREGNKNSGGVTPGNEAFPELNRQQEATDTGLQADGEQPDYDCAEAIFDAINEAILLLDKDLKVKTANTSFYKIFNTRKEETEGFHIYELGGKQWNIPRMRELLEDTLAQNNEVNGFELRHNFTGIGEKILLINVRRVPHKTNDQLLLLAIENVTEHKMLYENLERIVNQRTLDLTEAVKNLRISNSELEQFVYVASHDLQEPLRKMITFADRLQKSKDEIPEASKTYIDKITDSAERMTRLIDDLLNFSRVTSPGYKYVKADLNKIFKDALVAFETVIHEKNASIHADKLPILEAIPFQMEQLFNNLVSNSLKFVNEKIPPVISLSSRLLIPEEVNEHFGLDPSAAYVEILFKDNGIGFGAEFAEQIFVIFQRLHSRQKFPGTGIGLALCRKIVSFHDGIIFAKGSENEGATFHIILPLKQP